MDGLMQNVPLTVDRIIDHAANWHGGREIVSRDAEGRVTRTTYADIRPDAKRVANALAAKGIQPGDRVATMRWKGARHLNSEDRRVGKEGVSTFKSRWS